MAKCTLLYTKKSGEWAHFIVSAPGSWKPYSIGWLIHCIVLIYSGSLFNKLSYLLIPIVTPMLLSFFLKFLVSCLRAVKWLPVSFSTQAKRFGSDTADVVRCIPRRVLLLWWKAWADWRSLCRIASDVCHAIVLDGGVRVLIRFRSFHFQATHAHDSNKLVSVNKQQT